MKGIIGKFFFQFGVTVSAAVAFSLLEALTPHPLPLLAVPDVGERRTRIGKWVEAPSTVSRPVPPPPRACVASPCAR
jgi:HAE1 family hydrophobic/amphiphilic exporter-1